MGEKYHRLQLLFERNTKVKPEPADFDFALACEAAHADPTVRAYIEQVAQQAQKQGIEFSPDAVAIMLKHPVKPGMNVGVMAGNVFDTSSGKCVEQS